MKLFPSPPTGPRRGALGKGCLVAVASVLLILGFAGGCSVFKYNSIIAEQTGVEAKWSEIQNQYKRRFDLVPQLVETVKGAADFEKSTITEVTEARARVGQINLPDNITEDPSQLERFMEAQAGLGSALQRLLVVAENYPQLKATQNFLSLQDQLEGTENRISVARRDYIDGVKNYNISVRSFPGNLLAKAFGFQEVPQLDFEEEVTQAPTIDFGDDE